MPAARSRMHSMGTALAAAALLGAATATATAAAATAPAAGVGGTAVNAAAGSADSPAATSARRATGAATSPPPAGNALFAVTPAPACADPLCYWANSNQPGVPSLRASRTSMVMINPDIVDTTRGISHITADRADESGANIGNSQWVLTGHVRADMADGQLRCDTATIRIVDNRIATITARGGPALFQRPGTNPPARPAGSARASGTAAQKTDMANVTVRGHAQSILYDALHKQVQFSGDSSFTDGCNEITSQLVTYNMTSQIVQAGAAPGSNARVHGTIRNTHPGTACSAPAPVPAGNSGAAATGPHP